MTIEQAQELAQRCANETGVAQAVSQANDGEFFVFTCPQDIDDGIVAVIDPDEK